MRRRRRHAHPGLHSAHRSPVLASLLGRLYFILVAKHKNFHPHLALVGCAVASIELNGAPVGSAANAHRPHSFDVTRLLLPEGSGPNRLAVTLSSAVVYAAQQEAAYPYAVPATQVGGAGGHVEYLSCRGAAAASEASWQHLQPPTFNHCAVPAVVPGAANGQLARLQFHS